MEKFRMHIFTTVQQKTQVILYLSLRNLLTMLQKKTAVATNEVVTITSQWAGLCFCSRVCKLYH